MQRNTVRHALTIACNELELVLLRSQLAGATWTAARAHEHHICTDPRCPHCGAPAETDEHMLWACHSWEPARAAWRPLLEAAARPLPTLAVPSVWPACLPSAGLLLLALVPDKDALQLANDVLYRLYGMFLAVLAARKTAMDAAQQGGDPVQPFSVRRGAGRLTHAQPIHGTNLGRAHCPGLRPDPRWMHLRGCRRIVRGRRRFCMPCCGGQGPCCGSLARAKSNTWNWPWISKSMRVGPSQRPQGTSWRGVSCHYVNARTCSSSPSTERNSFCVLVSFSGASCAHFAMRLSRLEGTDAWVARRGLFLHAA